MLDERELVRRLGTTLIEDLEIEGCEIYLRDERSRHLTARYPAETGVELDPEVVAALDSMAEPVLSVELDARRPLAAAAFRAKGWEVGMPLRVNDRLTGLVALNRNRDLRIFSGEDLNILAGVASAASVALENARLSASSAAPRRPSSARTAFRRSARSPPASPTRSGIPSPP